MRSVLTILLIGCSSPPDDAPPNAPDDTGEAPVEETGPPLVDDTGTPPTDTGSDTQAPPDNDSVDNPLFTESFLGSGAPRAFTVADAVSAAPGDPEDWVAFTTPALRNNEVSIDFELLCAGTETIAIRIWDVDGPSPVEGRAGTQTTCATSPNDVLLETNRDYAARVYYPSGSAAPDYTEWTLTVSW
ncbi:MAG: hypothetical protein AAF211_13345 [Myxococcota bacterium]